MNALVSSESLKLRTLFLPKAVLAFSVALSGVIGYAVVDIAAGNGEAATLDNLATSVVQPTAFLVLIVAVLATAGEYSHRTIATTLVQAPRRGRMLVAKSVAAAAYGTVLAVVSTATAIGVGSVAMAVNDMPFTEAGSAVTSVLAEIGLTAVWAVLAVGLGALVRNSTVALVGVLIWKFVVENILLLVTNAPELARWMPTYAADAVLFGGEGTGLLTPAAGGLLFAGYVAAIGIAGAVVFLRRDPA